MSLNLENKYTNTVDFESYTTQERDELTLPFSILPALAKLFDFLLIVKQR